MKYEKPICVDAGTVAPVLGNSCSFGEGAIGVCQTGGTPASGDCSVGYGNSSTNTCDVGGGHYYCKTGNDATRDCWTGNGF